MKILLAMKSPFTSMTIAPSPAASALVLINSSSSLLKVRILICWPLKRSSHRLRRAASASGQASLSFNSRSAGP